MRKYVDSIRKEFEELPRSLRVFIVLLVVAAITTQAFKHIHRFQKSYAAEVAAHPELYATEGYRVLSDPKRAPFDGPCAIYRVISASEFGAWPWKDSRAGNSDYAEDVMVCSDLKLKQGQRISGNLYKIALKNRGGKMGFVELSLITNVRVLGEVTFVR